MEIEINDDFDLQKIHESGQCFRWEPIGAGEYRIPFRGECLRVKKTAESRYSLDCTPEEFERIWRGYFDLDENYSGIRSRIDEREDPFLFQASQYGTGIRILRQDLWETLVSFIISQNRSIPVIRRSVELLCRAAGERRTDREGKEYFAFPGPEELSALSDEILLGCRIGYRCRYIRAAAEYMRREGADKALGRLPDSEAIDELTKICGVGVKVASCTALFGLHRTDVFPVDTWIRKVLLHEYPRGYPRDRYSPYNGVFQQYMFAYYRSCRE